MDSKRTHMRAIRVGIIASSMVLSFLDGPPANGAQQTPKVARIGLLVTGPPPGEHACVVAFHRGMTELGLVEGRTHVLETAQGPFFLQHLKPFAELALKQKLPSFSGEPTAAKAGVLMSAGASIPASCHRAASYVDRILKGAKPSELPVEQSTTLGLEINLKTAKALGIVIPPSVLLRADHV